MPRVEVVFYRENVEEVPVLDWLTAIRRSDPKAYEKCVAAIGMLAASGHELRRPIADYLQEGVCELRIKRGHVNYRILYFFHARDLAILSHALTKEGLIPSSDLKRALRRKKLFEQAPSTHSYYE